MTDYEKTYKKSGIQLTTIDKPNYNSPAKFKRWTNLDNQQFVQRLS